MILLLKYFNRLEKFEKKKKKIHSCSWERHCFRYVNRESNNISNSSSYNNTKIKSSVGTHIYLTNKMSMKFIKQETEKKKSSSSTMLTSSPKERHFCASTCRQRWLVHRNELRNGQILYSKQLIHRIPTRICTFLVQD